MAGHTAPADPGSLRVAVPYLRPERFRLALSAGTATAEIGFQLLQPWPLALAIDHALGGRPLTGVLQPLAGLGTTGLLVAAGVATVAFSAVAGVLDAVSRASAQVAAERIGGAMRASVFSHVLGLSLRWHDRTRTGEILSRLTTDVSRVLEALVLVCASLLPNTVLLVSALALLFLMDPVLALIGVAVLPLLAWLTVRQRRRVKAAEMTAREASGRFAGTTGDLLRNVRAVQAFGRLDRAVDLYSRPNDAAVDARIKAVGVETRWSPVPQVVLAVGTGVVLVIGGLRVQQGTLTVGGLLVVLTYLGNLRSPVRALVRLTGVRAKAEASALRIGEVLSCTEAVRDPAEPRPVPTVPRGLRLEGVRFSYSDDRPVLDGFDLIVAPGETVCLFGPSGAGKSTVLHLLLRLYDVEAGRVLVDGVDVRDLEVVQLRRHLAFVPQDPWLLDGTIAENIAFGSATATRAEVLAAGRAAWVDEFALSLPEGYDTPLGEGGVRLSGGQRRRVALARAVVSRAGVVLLDEPTTSLDAAAARQVVGAIRSATRDRTVLLVTHDPVLAAIADRTVHVAPGRRPAPGATSGDPDPVAAPDPDVPLQGDAGRSTPSDPPGADRFAGRTVGQQ